MPATLPDDARCLRCGYLLRELPENRCPECGRSFDPSDFNTFRYIGQSFSVRRWARFPSGFEVLAILIPTLLFVWTRSGPRPEPYGDPDVYTLWFVCVVPVLVWWFGLRLASCLRWRRLPEKSRGTSPNDRRTWRWLVLPLCLSALLTISQFNWPLAIRFRLSEPAFAREVNRIKALQQQNSNTPTYVEYGHWVGLYYVWAASVRPGDRWIWFGIDAPCRGGFKYDLGNGAGCCPDELPPAWGRYESAP